MNEQDVPPRTYFGADDPPEATVRPAVPRSALLGLVALFVILPLLLLLGLIASGGPDRPGRIRPDAKPAMPAPAEGADEDTGVNENTGGSEDT